MTRLAIAVGVVDVALTFVIAGAWLRKRHYQKVLARAQAANAVHHAELIVVREYGRYLDERREDLR